MGAGLLILCGCTAKHYRSSADKEVYGIVQDVERRIFGHTNEFTIETSYSHRPLKTILPAELITDRLQTNRRVLSIEGALDLAAKQSRTYQSEKEKLYLVGLTLTGARYAFSPQFFAGSQANLDRTSGGEVVGSVKSSVGVNQLLRSGGKLGLSLANDLLRYYTGDPRRSAVSTFSVNLLQPLLRGFGRNNPSVESLTQAERSVVYAVRDYSYFQDQFAMEVVNDYFALLALKDVIRNRYTNYLSRADSTKRLEARSRDREKITDVDQARQSELTAKNSYVNALAQYQTSLDQFKIKLGLSVGDKVFLDDQALEELKQTGLIPVALEATEAYRLAVQKQLPILNALDRFEDLKRKIRVAADRLRADLNLLADASLASDTPTDYTQFTLDNLKAGAGLELNLPIDRLKERNDYRAALVAFEAGLRSLTLTLDTLREDIERGLRTLEQRRQNYLIQKNALALADRRVASTTLTLQAGLTAVRDLLEAQDAQVSAQNAVTAALVDYQVTRLQLMLDIGALDTETPQFWLKEHLAGFLPAGSPAARPTETAEKPLVPPDKFFNN